MTKKVEKTRTKSSAPWKVTNSAPFLTSKAKKSFKSNSKRNKDGYIPRDPRFSDLSGKLNLDLYRKSYGFIDEMLDSELNSLTAFVNNRKNINKTTNISEFGEIDYETAKNMLNKYKSHKNTINKKRDLDTLKRRLKHDDKLKQAKTNKKPFYYSQSKVKKLLKDNDMSKDVSKKKLVKKEKKIARKANKNIPIRRD